MYIYIYIYIYICIYIYVCVCGCVYLYRIMWTCLPSAFLCAGRFSSDEFMFCHRADLLTITLGRAVPNLAPRTMRVSMTNGRRNGLNFGRKVDPCPGSRRRWGVW